MDYQVEGEDITPGEITEALGWRTAGARKARSQRRDAAVSNGTALERAEPKRHGVNTKAGIKLGVIKASRMPPLPREEIKIVIRPQGGLNILKIGAPTVTTAIFASAKIAKEESTDDTVCPNPRQNIVVIEITGQIQEPIPEQGAVSFQVYIPSTVRSYRQGELGRRGWGHLTGGIGNSPRA
ncbi:hypothetical protein HPB50_019456 [Hyalomma asiaticum]|uniref:Uncharacterized protein n=1 Tax=Hyalomma asiaticum TaxID=266040 RepID=A0ACB7T8D1_HYAAI|nr:hypothetical protein HPB50_019456 [Hyalomma asiaticum]